MKHREGRGSGPGMLSGFLVLGALVGQACSGDDPWGAVFVSGVKSDDDAVVAVAVDVVLRHVDHAAVRVSANSAVLRGPAGAVDTLCVELAEVPKASVHVLAASGHFDSSVRLHAELREGTCQESGQYLADAVFPTAPAPNLPVGGDGGVSAGAGGAKAGSSGSGGAGKGNAGGAPAGGASGAGTAGGTAGTSGSGSGGDSGTGGSGGDAGSPSGGDAGSPSGGDAGAGGAAGGGGVP